MKAVAFVAIVNTLQLESIVINAVMASIDHTTNRSMQSMFANHVNVIHDSQPEIVSKELVCVSVESIINRPIVMNAGKIDIDRLID